MAKRQIQSIIDINNQTLTIEVEGHDSIICELSEIHTDMLNHAALHGLKQKICDAAALGAEYSISEKYTAMKEVFDRIYSAEPQWNKTAGGGGGATGLLFRALCRLYPDKSPEQLRAYHDKLDKKQQAALRGNPKIAPIIEKIKLEAANTTGVDSDELLAGLEDIE